MANERMEQRLELVSQGEGHWTAPVGKVVAIEINAQSPYVGSRELCAVVNFLRCGAPVVQLVTQEPSVRSLQEAKEEWQKALDVLVQGAFTVGDGLHTRAVGVIEVTVA